MHRYEVLFILRPDAPDDEIDKAIAQMEGYATAAGGKLEKTEKWGRRKLAYRVRGQREGSLRAFVRCQMISAWNWFSPKIRSSMTLT